MSRACSVPAHNRFATALVERLIAGMCSGTHDKTQCSRSPFCPCTQSRKVPAPLHVQGSGGWVAGDHFADSLLHGAAAASAFCSVMATLLASRRNLQADGSTLPLSSRTHRRSTRPSR
eukprot:363736-Chlamydomonas_euryale.AAC.12